LNVSQDIAELNLYLKAKKQCWMNEF